MKARDRRLERICAVEREYRTASIATAILGSQLRADPSALNVHRLRFQDFTKLTDNLEPTYLIRLFAEFEAGLREAWTMFYGRSGRIRTSDLLESAAARCLIPQDRLDGADAVREYRNSLVHETAPAVGIDLAEAKKHLCRYFAYLPLDW